MSDYTPEQRAAYRAAAQSQLDQDVEDFLLDRAQAPQKPFYEEDLLDALSSRKHNRRDAMLMLEGLERQARVRRAGDAWFIA